MFHSHAVCRSLRPPSFLKAGPFSVKADVLEISSGSRAPLPRAKRPQEVVRCPCFNQTSSTIPWGLWLKGVPSRSSTSRAAAGDSEVQTSQQKGAKAADEEEGISEEDVKASMSAAAGLLGASDTSSTWSMKDELPGLTDEPVYVLKKEIKQKTPGEVIFELLFLLGGMLDRPFEGGGQAMEGAAEVVIEKVEEELRRARREGVAEEKLTEVGRYVNLLAMDVKMLGAARKHETLVERCTTAQERVKGALKRAELLDK